MRFVGAEVLEAAGRRGGAQWLAPVGRRPNGRPGNFADMPAPDRAALHADISQCCVPVTHRSALSNAQRASNYGEQPAPGPARPLLLTPSPHKAASPSCPGAWHPSCPAYHIDTSRESPQITLPPLTYWLPCFKNEIPRFSSLASHLSPNSPPVKEGPVVPALTRRCRIASSPLPAASLITCGPGALANNHGRLFRQRGHVAGSDAYPSAPTVARTEQRRRRDGRAA